MKALIGTKLIILLVLFGALPSLEAFYSGPFKQAEPIQAQGAKTLKKLPLYFARNDGQFERSVKYYSVNRNHSIFYFTNDGIYFSFLQNKGEPSSKIPTEHWKKQLPVLLDDHKVNREVVKMIPLRASRKVRIDGQGLQKSRFNFFLGNDPKKWRTNVPAYLSVVYKDVYPGIDFQFHGNEFSDLEYDIIVNPGADPSKIRFAYEGIQKLKLDNTGDLVIELYYGKLLQHHPRIFQRVGMKTVEVSGSFKIDSDDKQGKFILAFDFRRYDPNYTLIIDPVISYSTYFGGTDMDSIGGADLDSSDFLYLTGGTESLDFPITPGAYKTILQNSDGFITKLSPDGNSIIYSTFLGGSDGDGCNSIKVDDTGAAYVGCFTVSDDFPLVNPFQSALNGEGDSAVAKLSPDGSALLYSSYLGGSDIMDQIIGIGLNNHGLYTAGVTTSRDFPLQNPLQATYGGGFLDGFITAFNQSGNQLIYSTYLGGNQTEYLDGLTMDPAGQVIVTGFTNSLNFPITTGAFDTVCGDGTYCGDAFVSKVAPSGSDLIYSTYLGGSSHDEGHAIAVDGTGAAYITGETSSDDFPTLNAAQPSRGNLSTDAFVTKITPDGSGLAYSTFLGGWASELGSGIAVDDAGSAYIVGQVTGGYIWPTNFPTIKPLPFRCHDEADPFITKVSPQGNSWEYSTCLGGSSSDNVYDIVVDGSRTAYVVGDTISDDFPVRNAIQPNRAGKIDGFITKISCDSVIGPSTFENVGFATFTIDLCLPRNSDSVIQYFTSDGSAVAGSDYVATSGTLTIPAGDVQGTIEVPLLDDNALEGEEDFFLNLTSSDIDLGGYPIRASLLDTEGLLYDNFEDGILDWNLLKENWYEGGGYLTGWAPRKAEIFAPIPWVPSGASGCGNCTIETTIKITYGDPFKIMLEAWYQNRSNKVELILNSLTNQWILKQRSDGKLVGKSKAAAIFTPFVPYDVVLSFDGVNFNLQVNGQQMISMKSGAPPFGNVGFKTKNYMAGIFERIRVY